MTIDASLDHLFDGRLLCWQPRQGYRFSIDAVLLAHFFTPAAGERIVDLGAGCGIVSLLLAFRHAHVRLTAVELQPTLAGLARRNIAANGFDERLRLVEGDVRRISSWLAAESCERVVSNPPYGRPAAGRLNADEERALARHELAGSLDDFVRAMAHAVKNRGRVDMVYPAARLAPLLTLLRSVRLEPKRLRMVHSYPGDGGRLVLVEAIKNGGEELQILPPLFIYSHKNGPYSEEIQRMYRP